MPKLEKSTDRDHKLISSESDEDTSACKIEGHFSPCVLREMLGKTPNLTHFTKSKWRQKEEMQQTMTII